MSTESIVVMVIMLTLTWGGFAFCLRLAVKKEKAKQ